MNSFFAQFPYLEAVLGLCILVGGFFGIKNGRQSSLSKFQEGTIKAQNDRIKILEDKIEDLEKENIRQRLVFEGQIEDLKKQNTEQQYVINTITSGLNQRGMVISVDGQLYPIADKPHTQRAKRTTNHPTPLAREKEDN